MLGSLGMYAEFLESWRRQYLPRRMDENEWSTSSYQSLDARRGGLELRQQSGVNYLLSK